MTARPSRFPLPAQAAPLDWLLLGLLVAISGSSFALIRKAVETAPPAGVAILRLWIGAALMYAIMRAARQDFPAPVDRSEARPRLKASWTHMLAISAIGYALPFFIFPWAQQYVESGLAGVYMAFMPVWTVLLASVFAGEPLTARKLAGFLLGFAGVVILMGPDVLAGAARSSILAQFGLLIATFCYAVSTVIARRAPPMPSRVFAAGNILGAAILAAPALFFVDLRISDWSIASALSIVGLAVGPTGLAGLIIIVLIRRAGAGFTALANYFVPVWAVVLGAALYAERLEPRVFAALAVILAAVAISQQRAKPPLRPPGRL